ncbi:NAD(P)/FAD-dependent oxidoreductase [Corallococcus praedator]|uniref:NADH:ubiquinone reductase (non-electrogenic) n=1 Tax=Corallococcus praedator TaxID=2316724 RepID=A0ABX9Q9I4_9BACT|nr:MULTISPECIES: NAD(P)/FAD-dependent oxidoreductase [Corallococcus]RKH22838.1 NAD(P)/FAD-dependent oxidoreductase [Corallococcus sp. CA031C]RKH93243.1 NAD(P)/FAD-dependent oxidoreductase [Corallococcus praedator]
MGADNQSQGLCVPAASGSGRKRVLILGGGFAGVYAALHLERQLGRRDDVEVTIVSRDNFFLFTPMLHEVAASDLNASAIVISLRKLLPHLSFVEGDLTGLDLHAKTATVAHGGLDGHSHTLTYDYVVLAMGSETNFFGKPGPRDHTLTMKTLGDAMLLRNCLIDRLEEADADCMTMGSNHVVTFVVVGGGFAGVETAGAINDFIHGALPFYPNIQHANVRVMLVHGGKEVLPELGQDLGAYTRKKLIEHGVEVRTGIHVQDVTEAGVVLPGGTLVPTKTVVWAAGVTPPSLLQSLPCEKERGRLKVNARMEVPGFPGVWALGDCASVPDLTNGGRPCPPTAQHALRQGVVVARNVCSALKGRPGKAFRYKMLGQLAAIGRRAGVARILGLKFSGTFAWFLWRSIYLAKLPRLETKVRVAMNWMLDLIFRKDVVQLIGPRELDQLTLPAFPLSSRQQVRHLQALQPQARH